MLRVHLARIFSRISKILSLLGFRVADGSSSIVNAILHLLFFRVFTTTIIFAISSMLAELDCRLKMISFHVLKQTAIFQGTIKQKQ